MSEINRVLVDRAQDFTEAQKAQGRANIGAQGALSAGANISISDNVISAASTTYVAGDNITISGNTISANVPELAIKQYGAQTNTPVSSLVLNADDPEGYVTVKADNGDVGELVAGPYSTLLNSGVDGVGDSTHAVYIDTDGTFKQASESGTTVETTSSPYSTSTAQSRLTVYDPGSDFGSLVKDTQSNNIGFLLPKHYGQNDLGKVPTVVDDSGYKIEWRDQAGGIPQITPMGAQTYYASGNDYINLEDNVAYFIETKAGGSFTIHLGTLSRQTIHSKIYLVGTLANCVTMTVVYEDEAGQVCKLDYVYGDTQSDTYYGLDVYARLVTIGGGRSISYDTTMCRVSDYPCQTRSYFSSDNNNIGLVVNYVEPL